MLAAYSVLENLSAQQHTPLMLQIGSFACNHYIVYDWPCAKKFKLLKVLHPMVNFYYTIITSKVWISKHNFGTLGELGNHPGLFLLTLEVLVFLFTLEV